MQKLEVVSEEEGVYRVKYKKGQKEYLKQLAEMAGITLDELIAERISEATGKKICSTPLEFPCKNKPKKK